jgi:hypothetical protein
MHPWVWEAEYRDGRRLRQFDADGFHRSAEIDGRRVAALVLHGHPASPCRWFPPEPLAVGPVLRVEITVQSVLTLGPRGLARALGSVTLIYHCAAGRARCRVPASGAPPTLTWEAAA